MFLKISEYSTYDNKSVICTKVIIYCMSEHNQYHLKGKTYFILLYRKDISHNKNKE